jgi:hypothetical protein
MEEILPKNQNILNIKSKRQLYFGKNFDEKIKQLKVFIYGLKGVNKYLYFTDHKLFNNIVRF